MNRLTEFWRQRGTLGKVLVVVVATLVAFAIIGAFTSGPDEASNLTTVLDTTTSIEAEQTTTVEAVDEQPSLPQSKSTLPQTTRTREVRGWPHTAQNPAGAYSWDRHTCAGQWCSLGFMHNGYGSGDVEIVVEFASEAPIQNEDATAVTIAGHDGIHRRIDAGTEEWIVGIQQTTLAIRLEAKQGASDADLAEAHAIIKSMRTEPRDTKLGYRLVFTLMTNDWDSG